MTPGLVPGQVYVGAAVLGAAILAVFWSAMVVVIVAAVIREGKRRRQEASVLAQLDVCLHEALADPTVQAGLARLDAAARKQSGGESA